MAGREYNKHESASSKEIGSLIDFYERANIHFKRAEGVYLYSEQGNKYLDMSAGYAVNNLGHANPKLIKVLENQASKFWHLCNRYNIPNTKEFCDTLTRYAGMQKVYPCNVGAEAVESALKFARRYFYAQKVKRYRFITIEKAFHGRTFAAATASSPEKMENFGPPFDSFDRVKFNDIKDLERAITKHTAGVLIEPVQGEGGMRPHDKEYMIQLRKLCDKHGILLIFDEIQCGMGRTGHLFAAQYYKVKPDILILAKGLGCGFPVAAVVTNNKIAKYLNKGDHGSTFGGNPLAMAVATQVLKMMDDKLMKRVQEIEKYTREKLDSLCLKHHRVIREVRGVGLMIGIKLHDSYDPDEFMIRLRNHFVLVIPAADNVVRITPPLTITKGQIDEFCKAFNAVCKEES